MTLSAFFCRLRSHKLVCAWRRALLGRNASGGRGECDRYFQLGVFMKVNKVHAAVVAALTGVGGLTYQTAFAPRKVSKRSSSRPPAVSRISKRYPISIVAITGENLETRGIDNLEEVSQGVPNIVITGGAGGTGGTSFRMRGIPNVGTYIDGIWQVGTAGFLTQEFVDIDRVEVLRGPQGTMFGRDSTGGAIRIWTKRPAEEFGGNIHGHDGLARSPRRQGVARSAVRRQRPHEVDGREPVPRRLHHEPDDRPERRRHRPAGAPRRHRLGRDRQARLPLQLPERQELVHRAARHGRDVPHVRRPNAGWVKTIIGLPEFYTYVGTDSAALPSSRSTSGQPGVGLSRAAASANGRTARTSRCRTRYDTEQVSIETNWQISDNLNAAVPDGADGARCRLGHRLGQHPVRPRARHEPQQARRVQPGDPAHRRPRPLRVARRAPTTGINRSTTRNGRWQVNEFQKG